jgi:hypothetical protein
MSSGPLQPETSRFEPSSNTQRATQYSHLATTPALRLSPPPPEAAPLPTAYGMPLFELLVVDPQNVFVSWEITAAQLAATQEYFGPQAFPQRRLTARFYTAQDTDAPRFVTELFGEIGRWFVSCEASGQELQAVLAFEAGGRHFPLATAGPVSLPRSSPVEVTQYEELAVQYELLPGGRLLLSSAKRKTAVSPAVSLPAPVPADTADADYSGSVFGAPSSYGGRR